MKTILKFQIEPKSIDVQKIELPKGAEILSIQTQRENLCIWILGESDNDYESRSFFIARTGDPFPANPSTFIMTFQLLGGAFVGHVFELINNKL